MQRIRPLTGLRGVAAVWVVAYHFVGYESFAPTGIAGAVVRHGYLAVDIFFVLSGFVMSLSYRGLFAPGISWRSCLRFLIKRIARVYPLYAIVTVAIALVSVSGLRASFHIPKLGQVLAINLLMVQTWGFAESINGPSWSISTEFAAYLIFPWLLIAVMGSTCRTLALVSVICLGTLLYIAHLPDPSTGLSRPLAPLDVPWAYTPWPLLRCLAEFSLGVVAYRIAKNASPTNSAPRKWAAYAVVLAVLGLV